MRYERKPHQNSHVIETSYGPLTVTPQGEFACHVASYDGPNSTGYLELGGASYKVFVWCVQIKPGVWTLDPEAMQRHQIEKLNGERAPETRREKILLAIFNACHKAYELRPQSFSEAARLNITNELATTQDKLEKLEPEYIAAKAKLAELEIALTNQTTTKTIDTNASSGNI